MKTKRIDFFQAKSWSARHRGEMDLGILWLANSTIPTLPMMRINSDALSMSTKMCYGLQKGSIWHNREMQPATAFSPHTKAPGRLSSKKVSKPCSSLAPTKGLLPLFFYKDAKYYRIEITSQIHIRKFEEQTA